MNYYIITHPLRGNYGGMLQALSLHIATNKIVQSVYLCDIQDNKVTHPYRSFINSLKITFSVINRYLINRSIRADDIAYLFHRLGRSFAKKHFQRITSERNPEDNRAYIVGSDQVWRCLHTRALIYVDYFFLDFATRAERKRSISYAASFGTDEWEGTPDETNECGRLLREFKAVSVREHSGVKICKEVFGVEAVQMPDPTLLLHQSEYETIINGENTWQPERKYVAAYVLDETAGKAELLQESAGALNSQLQHLMPHSSERKRRDRFPISVPQWLRLIRDCEYFITDSFHGCVFAIIYNKPFVCLGNAGRGNARFDTLLGTFGLEDRLLTATTPEEIQRVLNTPIDWERVNAIHNAERDRGINFLKENLAES